MRDLTLSPIGIFRCSLKQPAEAASQGHLSQSEERGLIELGPGSNFEQALTGLFQMTHLWVLFWFHQKNAWKPMVQVPRGSDDKLGVFATRSPHRPNPLGLSLVRIDEIKDRRIWVREFDLLDETPILDLKPYHPEADVAHEPVQFGWMGNLSSNEYEIDESDLFQRQAAFLFESGVTALVPLCRQQLRFDPFNSEKKRVTVSSHDGILAYRTWRIHFSHAGHRIRLERIRSGYTQNDMSSGEDRWQDKVLHSEFTARFENE